MYFAFTVILGFVVVTGRSCEGIWCCCIHCVSDICWENPERWRNIRTAWHKGWHHSTSCH